MPETELEALRRRLRAWIRGLQAVPSDVTTVDRWIVAEELEAIIRQSEQS